MAKDNDDSLVGKVKEKMGWLTADRKVEAKGKLRRLEREHDDPDDESDETKTAAAQEAENDVRADYGEYDPDVDDAPTAADTRPIDHQP